jgi:hypothetical protein
MITVKSTKPKTDVLRPVCAGLLYQNMDFSPIVFHPHPHFEDRFDKWPRSAGECDRRDDCPIRTYISCHEVDDRFDGQFVTSQAELAAAACAMVGAVRGRIRVVMPIALSECVYGFVDD